MTGLLVAVVMLLFVCVPPSAPWADTAPGLQNRVAQADNSQIVPPDPEQSAEAPVASSAAEVLRLRDLIGEKRDEIEAGRSAALEQVEATYRADLAAIEPKDMFETELEYQQRDAREKSEVELQRARDVSDVHREHDLALRDEVEPMVQQVRELLSRDDIVPADAIDSHLENYDAERKVFTGTLKIDSVLVQMNARIYLPMKREDAKALWKNRELLKGKVRVSMSVRSLDIGLEEFWLEDPESGSRTEERIAVVEMRHPGERAASAEKRQGAARFKSSALALANRAAKKSGFSLISFENDNWRQGVVAEYNRLIQEAKSVFSKDPHVQGLRPLQDSGSNSQVRDAVATAAHSLETYFSSLFRSDMAFVSSASALANRAAKKSGFSLISFENDNWRQGMVAEYNRLIQEAKSVFSKDPHVQGLRPLQDSGSNSQVRDAVATAAHSLETYFSSLFRSDMAFVSSASALANRAAKKSGFSLISFENDNWRQGMVAEYNRLIQEAKSVFSKDPHVQGLRPLQDSGSNSQVRDAVATAAHSLETYFSSLFRSDMAFVSSASALANRAAKKSSFSLNSFENDNWGRGVVAEYNRLIQEAKSVFSKDPHVQALKELHYGGSGSWGQAAGVVASAAKKLESIMANVKTAPRKIVAQATTLKSPPLNYLPYSGRFSPDAHKLAKLLGRGFSPDARDENGWTDLHYAAVLNLPGLASALLDAGADPNAKLKRDGKAFSFRLKSTLSQFGLGVENWVRADAAPLIYAAVVNAHSVAALLLAHGAEVDAQVSWGDTPLHSAAIFNAHSVAELLIGRGANLRAKRNANLPDFEGWTPLDLSIFNKAAEAEALLRRHEAPCNKKCS